MRRVNLNPRCSTCIYMLLYGRANPTRDHIARGVLPRGKCRCTHPQAEVSFKTKCPKSNRAPCFIGFTAVNEKKPTLKGAPIWCPLKAD